MRYIPFGFMKEQIPYATVEFVYNWSGNTASNQLNNFYVDMLKNTPFYEYFATAITNYNLTTNNGSVTFSTFMYGNDLNKTYNDVSFFRNLCNIDYINYPSELRQYNWNFYKNNILINSLSTIINPPDDLYTCNFTSANPINSFTSPLTINANDTIRIEWTDFTELVPSNITTITNGTDAATQLLIGGVITKYNGIYSGNDIFQIYEDGCVSTGFTYAATNILHAQKLNNGQFMVAWNDYSSNVYFNRLNSNGTNDATFSHNTLTWSGKFLTLSDYSTIWLGSISPTFQNPILKLDTNGTFDSGFLNGYNTSGNYTSLDSQSTGKLICVGNFTTVSGVTKNRIIRLNTDGTFDNTFTTGTGFDATTNVVKVLSDNTMLIGGNFTSYSGISANKIIKLNTDGTKYTGFTYGTGFNGNVTAIDIQSDNKIIVGGNFTSYSGVSSNNLIRLNSDGTVDNTFSSGSGFSMDYYSGSTLINVIKVLPDGYISIGGKFGIYNGSVTQESGIIILTSTGSVSSFTYICP